jgi:hypothetical protein
VFVYPSGLDLPGAHLRFLTARLRERRRAIGSRWRRLSAGRQALLALAHLRNGHTYVQLAAGFGIGTTTTCRYITEVVDLLAALAPTLEQAVRQASRKAFVLLDGTVLPIDRIAADRPFYSGKRKKQGMNVPFLADPAGRLLWASPALPGAVHNMAAPAQAPLLDHPHHQPRPSCPHPAPHPLKLRLEMAQCLGLPSVRFPAPITLQQGRCPPGS